MKIIPIKLPNKKASIPCYVDDEDYRLLSQFRWYMHCGGNNNSRYACKNVSNKFSSDRKKQKKILMHRAILWCPDGYEIDHINGNAFDNRKSNLRIVTHRENCKNRITNGTRGSHSKYAGVTLHASGKWQAQIRRGRKMKYLGLFESEEEAYKKFCEESV